MLGSYHIYITSSTLRFNVFPTRLFVVADGGGLLHVHAPQNEDQKDGSGRQQLCIRHRKNVFLVNFFVKKGARLYPYRNDRGRYTTARDEAAMKRCEQ